MIAIKPNIVLVMTDQQRYDCLGTSGNDLIGTPHLDGLAAESATFDRFFVTNPVCVPSRASFLTGRYPVSHRCRDLEYALGSDERHLPAILKDAGYDLALSGKNHVLAPSELEVFEQVLLMGHEKARVPAARGPFGSGVDPTPLDDYPTNVVCRHAVEFLESRRHARTPFFHWISFPDPHSPYQAPEPYASMYDPARVPAPVTIPGELEGKPLAQRLIRELQGMDGASEQQVREMIAVYYGMVSCVDDAVGRILGTLADTGLDNDTIVVFTSDHGDYLGEHGLARKSWHFYDSLLHVPFLLRWPGRIRPQRVRTTMAENVDLLPTLLELAELPVPVGNQGKSVVPFLDGGTDKIKDSVFAFVGGPGDRMLTSSVEEWLRVRGDRPPYWSIGAVQGCMIRTSRWKLSCYADGQTELYDLERDPGELHNLSGAPGAADVEHELARELLLARMSKEDPRPPAADRFSGLF